MGTVFMKGCGDAWPACATPTILNATVARRIFVGGLSFGYRVKAEDLQVEAARGVFLPTTFLLADFMVDVLFFEFRCAGLQHPMSPFSRGGLPRSRLFESRRSVS